MKSGKDPDENRLLNSFGDIVLHVKKTQPGTALPDPGVDTDWYMVLYDNEYLGKGLAVALPTFLAHVEFDYFTMYKRTGTEGNMKYYMSPRLYQKRIRLNGESLVPVGHNLQATAILDGYIFE
jgi:signal peptidase I